MLITIEGRNNNDAKIIMIIKVKSFVNNFTRKTMKRPIAFPASRSVGTRAAPITAAPLGDPGPRVS